MLLARAAPVTAEEIWSPPVQIAAVPAGDRLELDDGRDVRLAGIRVAPPGSADAEVAASAWRRDALAAAVDGARVRLATSAAPMDRYGALVAQVERIDGVWLQGELLAQGLAQVQTRPGETARAAAMLELEHEARAAERGLWRHPAFAPQPADRLAGSARELPDRAGRSGAGRADRALPVPQLRRRLAQ